MELLSHRSLHSSLFRLTPCNMGFPAQLPLLLMPPPVLLNYIFGEVSASLVVLLGPYLLQRLHKTYSWLGAGSSPHRVINNAAA